jgi:peroxiredoxin
MKGWIIASALLLMGAAAEPLRVGDLAPDFRLMDQSSHIVRLAAARGHKVVLVFYRGYW